MNLKRAKSQAQLMDGLTTHQQIDINPIFIVAKKTFLFNVCTPKKLIMGIILMVLVPVITLLMTPTTLIPNNATLTGSIGFILFFYSFGIIFPLLIGTSAAPLISEELKSGTMIILVSKPISRHGIVIGKLIALFLFGIIVSIISLLSIIIVGMTRYPFTDLPQFFLLHFIYSLIIMICFGGLTLGFSCIFKRPRNVTLIPVLLVIFSFFIALIIKQALAFSPAPGGSSSIYEQLQIYHFDISYHMGNLYKFLTDIYIPGASEGQNWAIFLLSFGVKKYDQALYCDGTGNCQTISGIIINTNYYLPIFSGIMLILIGVLLLIGGVIFLKKRDIS